ncbi:AAA family ATPase [Aeromonas veronii]|uniref:alpha/beta hydrolase n=1 Tax=Aeromonas veronii TaxID=654 RepID=UPI0003A10831
MEQSKQINRGWYRNLDSDTVIIFIHGLMSNCNKCWKNENGAYWPELASNDPRLDGVSIYLSEYYTSATSGDFDFNQCANEVFTDITTVGPNLQPPPIHKKKIIFVGHSAGGVISRLVVEKNRLAFKDKKIGFFLVASPSLGSDYNLLASIFIRIFDHSLAKELKWKSPILQDLDDRFRDIINRKELDICGRELFENKIKASGIIAFFNRKIVEKESARRYFGSGVMIPKSDHSSICKPNDFEHHSHKELCKFISDNFPLVIRAPVLPKNAAIKDCLSDPLFERYKKDHEQYYIIKNIDTQLANTFHKYSIWVCGCSGVGKTVSIQRALMLKNLKFRYISLARSVNETIEQMYTDLLSELNDYNEIPTISKSHTLKLISEKIEQLSDEGYSALFIEEIPIKTKEEFIEFSESLFTIIPAVDSSKNTCHVILSSIFEPPLLEGTEFEKNTNKLKIIKVNKWNTQEIERLCKVIEEGLGISLLTRHEEYDSFNGSPRAVKKFYSDHLFNKRAS